MAPATPRDREGNSGGDDAADFGVDVRPVYRCVESSRPVLAAGLALMSLGAILLISGAAPTVGLVVAVSAALAVLALHSLEVNVDDERFEVRMGNGWRRLRIGLETIEGVRVETDGPRWAAGRRTRDGHRRFGVGSAGRVIVRTASERIEIATEDPTDLAAAILARRPIETVTAGTDADDEAEDHDAR